jgi:hypothetical protein
MTFGCSGGWSASSTGTADANAGPGDDSGRGARLARRRNTRAIAARPATAMTIATRARLSTVASAQSRGCTPGSLRRGRRTSSRLLAGVGGRHQPRGRSHVWGDHRHLHDHPIWGRVTASRTPYPTGASHSKFGSLHGSRDAGPRRADLTGERTRPAPPRSGRGDAGPVSGTGTGKNQPAPGLMRTAAPHGLTNPLSDRSEQRTL